MNDDAQCKKIVIWGLYYKIISLSRRQGDIICNKDWIGEPLTILKHLDTLFKLSEIKCSSDE